LDAVKRLRRVKQTRFLHFYLSRVGQFRVCSLHCKFDFPSHTILSFVAAYFGEFPMALLDCLPGHVLELVVSHTALKLTNEDCLLESIEKKTERDCDGASLIEHSQFEFLSRRAILNFVREVMNFSIIYRYRYRGSDLPTIQSSNRRPLS
jgi:hypothetical protein